MDQVKKNKAEILEMIEKYGKMPIDSERAAFLSNCWAAYNALCMIRGDEESRDAAPHEYAAHDGCGEKSLTKDQVMRWVASMENADGAHGGHWTMEQTEQVREKRNIDCDPLMFYAAMNMMYSDYCNAAENAHASNVDFYAYMAKAFLDDKDAVDDKLGRYFSCIVKH